jgi:hypothetical protein
MHLHKYAFDKDYSAPYINLAFFIQTFAPSFGLGWLTQPKRSPKNWENPRTQP